MARNIAPAIPAWRRTSLIHILAQSYTGDPEQRWEAIIAPWIISVARRVGAGRAIALGLVVAAAAVAPSVWKTRFVRHARASYFSARADSALASNEDDRARGFLRSALRLRPEDAAARRRLASIELKHGDWEIALLDFQELQEFTPDDPEPFVMAAKVK